jgi:hypothetical protein
MADEAKTYGAQIKELVEAKKITEANKLIDDLITAGVIVYSEYNRPMVCVNWGVQICLTDKEVDKGWFLYRDRDYVC